MPRPKAPAWTTCEIAILREHYPLGGINAVTDLLPERSWQAIYVMACKLGLRAPPAAAPKSRLQGKQLEAAIEFRERDRWSFARIGAHFGVSESSACNAVMIALCTRKGFRPAERDANGRLLPEGLERLRYALRKGYKGIEIQLRLGLSSSRIAEERRRYNRELKANGKALLPAPGNGQTYSGVKVPRDRQQQVQELFMQGLGTKKIHERTGVGHATIVRYRAKLVARLRRKGECLPGCDIDGHRRITLESTRYIPTASINELRSRILSREPVARAARELGISTAAAYKIRDQLAGDLRERGEALPKPLLLGRGARAQSMARSANWLPPQYLQHYRALASAYGHDKAKQHTLERIAADKAVAREQARRPKTFEEQLAAVASGAAQVIAKPDFRRVDPGRTLGGVATGQL